MKKLIIIIKNILILKIKLNQLLKFSQKVNQLFKTKNN